MSPTLQQNGDGTNKNGMELLTHSLFFQTYTAEREEILRHKWLESEKAGRDIGFEHALIDWILYHRSAWRKAFHIAHTIQTYTTQT
jgi:hypothetical protein